MRQSTGQRGQRVRNPVPSSGGSANPRDAPSFDPTTDRSRVANAHGDRLVICPGTQNALFNLLVVLTRPGDVVLTEALTYPGIKTAAAYTGVRLIGLPMDEAGILPDAVNSACRDHDFESSLSKCIAPGLRVSFLLTPAGHAYRGMTPRNRSLFLERGHGYVYLVYGSAYMLNAAREAMTTISARRLSPLGCRTSGRPI
jgi:Methylpurine-DNA glycosylase (MPG)